MAALKKMLLGPGLAIAWLSICGNAFAAQLFNFTTLAGNAGYGIADGTGPQARFNFPQGIASDNSGNVYVADTANSTIRKIDTNGLVSTLAGLLGVAGYSNSTGSNARFSHPQGIAIGITNLYVADTANSVIRQVTSAGEVTVIAGSAGFAGSSNGIDGAALFNYPGGIAVDGTGALFVADTHNSTVRMLEPSGNDWIVSTIAGSPGVNDNVDGTNSGARFNQPSGIAVDTNGNVFVADTANNAIRKITLVSNNWVTTTLVTNLVPMAIMVGDSNNLYIANAGDNTVRKVSPSGTNWTISVLAGSAGESGSADGTAAARFNYPSALAWTTNGVLYVADSLNNIIRSVTRAGLVSTVAGLAGGAGSNDGPQNSARFNAPLGLALDASGICYVADSQNNTIRRVTPGGVVQTIAEIATNLPGNSDGKGLVDAAFSSPAAVAVDSATNIYVADLENNEIRKLTPTGTNWIVTTIAGRAGPVYYGPVTNAAGGLTNVSIVFSALPNNTNYSGLLTNISGGATNVSLIITNTPLYTNISNGGPQVIMLATNAFTLPSASTRLDGIGTNALFHHPTGLSLDSAGNLYVADGGTNGLRIVTSNNVVSTVSNSLGSYSIGTNLLNYQTSAVAIDNNGNIFIADSANTVVRQIAANGMVTTIAGAAGLFGNIDGTNSRARFGSPTALVLDAQTNIYVTDSLNHIIRQIAPFGTNWVVTTVGGLASNAGSADGQGSQARFSGPAGIALDGWGNLYVADTGNNTIRFGRATVGGVSLQISIVGNLATISWPVSAANFAAETSANLNTGGGWTPLTNLPSVVSNEFVVTNVPTAAAAFFRLRHN